LGCFGTIAALTATELVVLIVQYVLVARRLASPRLHRRMLQFAAVTAASIGAGTAAHALVRDPYAAHALVLGVFLAGCAATGILSRDVLDNLSQSRQRPIA
jgi:hypothetical protein